MIGLYIKATNTNTKEILYEGLKKTYYTYEEAMNDMRKTLHSPHYIPSSHRFPKEDAWDNHEEVCYVSCRMGSCIVTIYIEQI